MVPPPKENIVLIGFMGTGKSGVGRQLAKKLGFQFLDTDHLIEERERQPISQIFAERGEAAFRALETATLLSLEHLKRCVFATGGGTVLRPENHPILHSLGFVVRLTAAEETIFERVSRNNKRPLLQTENPRATMQALLAARESAYVAAAQLTVDTTQLSLAQAAEEIARQARALFRQKRAGEPLPP